MGTNLTTKIDTAQIRVSKHERQRLHVPWLETVQKNEKKRET